MAEQGQGPAGGRSKSRSDKAAEQPARQQPGTQQPGTQQPGTQRGDGSGGTGRTPRVAPRAEHYLVAPTRWAAATGSMGTGSMEAGSAEAGSAEAGSMGAGSMGAGTGAGPGDGPPLAGQNLIEALRRDPQVRMVRVVRSAQQESPSVAFAGPWQYPLVAVVEMAPDRAMALAARPDVHVDIDDQLRQGEPLPPASPWDDGTGTLGQSLSVIFQVRDERGEPLPDAVVHVQGGLYPVAGTTGADGTVELPVPVDTPDAVRGVYVRPRADCWSTWLGQPPLAGGDPNPVVCRRLDNGDPERAFDAWAHRALGLDRLPPTYRGHGVKVALIGSGVDATHPDLADRLAGGIDIVGPDEKSWDRDMIGRGTHHAALIAGHHMDNGLVGAAPDAEVHVCRVLPGGRLGDLIEALDYCIANEIDVVDLGVHAVRASGLVIEKIDEARRAGILCIAAAGDNDGPGLFPGTLPTVLTVGAVGRLGTYPPDSYHAAQVHGTPTPEGYFAARFSASGPGIDLCAPGVAVIAAAAAGGYTALDGTGTASAYVTALASLVLAHHPDFRYDHRGRGPARVDRLAYLIKESCRPLPGIDPYRCGAGLPDATVAVGLVPPVGVRAPEPDPATLYSAMLAAGLFPPGLED